MKKYDFIFKLSFINYLLTLYCMNVGSSSYIILFLLVSSFAYQIAYILFLREKENVSFLKSIANYFLYLTYTSDIFVIEMFLSMIIDDSGWEGVAFIIIGLPIFIISSIYQFIYYIIKSKKNKEINKL